MADMCRTCRILVLVLVLAPSVVRAQEEVIIDEDTKDVNWEGVITLGHRWKIYQKNSEIWLWFRLAKAALGAGETRSSAFYLNDGNCQQMVPPFDVIGGSAPFVYTINVDACSGSLLCKDGGRPEITVQVRYWIESKVGAFGTYKRLDRSSITIIDRTYYPAPASRFQDQCTEVRTGVTSSDQSDPTREIERQLREIPQSLPKFPF